MANSQPVRNRKRRQIPQLGPLIRPVRPPRPWVPYIVLAISLALTGSITWVVYDGAAENDQVRFENDCARVIRGLENRMDLYIALLRSGSGLFSMERTLTLEEFQAFHRRLEIRQRFAGMEAVGFARHVPVAKADSLQNLIFRNYEREIPLRPDSTPYSERYAVTLVTPGGQPTDALVGLDLYATPEGSYLIGQAIERGEALLARADLLVDREWWKVSQARFLLLAPAYDLGIIPPSTAERHQQIRGIFFGAFTAGEFLADIARDIPVSEIAYTVYDGDSALPNQLLYSTGPTPRTLEKGKLSAIEQITIAGHTWTFAFRAGPGFYSISERKILPIVAFSGLLFSLGIFFVTRSQVRAFEQLEESAVTLHNTQKELADLNRELEERVELRTAELESSNRELQAFAYSVSHDLRAPLRGIDGFSKFLLEDYSDRLDETGRDYLRRVRDGARRMGEIIDDLLTLSRVTRWEMTREDLDLSDLAQSIFARLQDEDPERTVAIEVQPGMVARADRRLVTIALENLLENAWKFTSKREDARISFTVAEEPTPSSDIPVRVYSISDNGAGFDQQYASELFESFRRLHSPNEFTGTGIGLATVQRVIARHNGEVWGEGSPGEGATFRFTLG